MTLTYLLQLLCGTCSHISLSIVTSVSPQQWHKGLPPWPSTSSLLCTLPLSCFHHWYLLSAKQFREGSSPSLSILKVGEYWYHGLRLELQRGIISLKTCQECSPRLYFSQRSPKSDCLALHFPKYFTVLLLATYPNQADFQIQSESQTGQIPLVFVLSLSSLTHLQRLFSTLLWGRSPLSISDCK